METDAEKINDADRQIKQRLYDEAQQYANTQKDSRALNKTRADSRKKVGEMGFRTDAYQTAIKVVKDLSAGERADFLRDFNLIVGVLGARQADLFPEEALKAAKREQQRKEKAAEEKTAKGRSSDHPRSDPKAGGAGKASAAPKSNVVPMGGVKEGDALIRDVAARKKTEAEAAEQAAGAAILDAHKLGAAAVPPEPPGEPKSQSAIAAEKLAAAKLY